MSNKLAADMSFGEPTDDDLTSVHTAYTPLKFALFGLLGWLVVLALGPVRIRADFDPEALAYLVISLSALLVGMWISNNGEARPRITFINPLEVPHNLFNIVAMTGTLGIILRITDRFVLRGMQVSANLLDNRLSLQGEPTTIGVFGALLFPFGLALIPILWSLPAREQTRTRTTIAYFFLAYPALESLIQASRSGILQAVFLWFFYSILFGRNAAVTRRPFMLGLSVLGLLALFEVIFTFRTDELGIDFLVASQTSGFSFFLPPSDWAISTFVTGRAGFIGTLVATWLHFTQYLCHGFFVYFANFQGFVGPHTDGALNFGILVKAYYSLLGLGEVPNWFDQAGGLSGLSGTFFTPLYYDFGWVGPVPAFLVGFLMTKVYRMTLERPWQWAPLSAFFAFTALMLMVDNMMTGGVAIFACISLILYAAVARLVASFERHDAFDTAQTTRSLT